MPRLRRTLAILVLLCATASVQAELRVTESVVQLGEVRGGAPVKASFALYNAGQETIEIVEVNRGCGCLAPRLEKRLLEPGEKTNLFLDFRAFGQPNGPHTWNATVRYKAGQSLRDAPLAVRATVKNEVTVQPHVLALFVENALRHEVTLTDVRQPPLAVTLVETTSRVIKVQTKTEGGGVTKIILEASGAGIEPGRYDEMLNIYTTDPLYGHLQVPVTLTRAPKTAVLATPDRVVLTLEGGRPASALVRLRPRGEKPVVVERVEAEDPAVACTWAAGPGTGATLRLEVRSARALTTTVRVHLTGPLQETLVIPVRVESR